MASDHPKITITNLKEILSFKKALNYNSSIGHRKLCIHRHYDEFKMKKNSLNLVL